MKSSHRTTFLIYNYNIRIDFIFRFTNAQLDKSKNKARKKILDKVGINIYFYYNTIIITWLIYNFNI